MRAPPARLLAATLLLSACSDGNPLHANAQHLMTGQDIPVAITLSGSSANGTPFIFQVVAAPSHGTLTGTPPDLTYTPDAGYCGEDSFQFVTADGAGQSDPATVTVTVNAPPTIIVLTPDSGGGTGADTFTIEWVDDDPDSNAAIALYYDTDDLGNDGTEIATSISEDDPTNSYVWSTAAVVPGEYYVCARIDDGVNAPVFAYSEGVVTIPTNFLGVPKTEYDALVALYNSTTGPGWSNNTGWLTASTPWFGVTVLGGHVAEVDLRANNLAGPIPPEIGDLRQLTTLSLYSNGLTGSIPPEIGTLAQLTYLNLFGNSLSGGIPPEIGDLAQLTYLGLASNSLSGNIPPEICNLTQLALLSLGSNSLTGSIPPEIGNLTELTWLDAPDNSLTASIPPEIGNLTQLRWLSLAFNGLSGGVPPEICNILQLRELSLSHNSLAGSIPPEIGNLTQLTWLDLGNNDLSGSIPPELEALVQLTTLYLVDNDLTGTISNTVPTADVYVPWVSNLVVDPANQP